MCKTLSEEAEHPAGYRQEFRRRRGRGPAGTSFWVDVPGQVGDGSSHHVRFLLKQSDPLLRFAEFGGFVFGHAGLVAVFDVCPF